jgi:hypothetical protein
MGRPFYAPPQFTLSQVVAAGQVGGRVNFAAMNSAVGHFGTFDYQRVGTPLSLTFYSGYTPVSNIDVGAFFGTGFSGRCSTTPIHLIHAYPNSLFRQRRGRGHWRLASLQI